MPISTRLDSIEGELQRGVAEALYRSGEQRIRRSTATTLLGLKHTLRGVLFSWPLYLLGLASFALPPGEPSGEHWIDSRWLLLILLLPAVAVSFSILRRGIREDYCKGIHNTLLDWQDVRQLLLKGAP